MASKPSSSTATRKPNSSLHLVVKQVAERYELRLEEKLVFDDDEAMLPYFIGNFKTARDQAYAVQRKIEEQAFDAELTLKGYLRQRGWLRSSAPTALA